MQVPIVREGIVPPGGWHYPENNTKIHSQDGTYRGLIKAVLEHRLANQIPAGDPETDVRNYICRTFPNMCQTPNQPQPQVAVAPPATAPNVSKLQQLIDDLLTWGNVTARNVGQLELPEEAKRRADICERCEFNVKWEHGCSACVGNANRLFNLMRQMKNVPRHKKLYACGINRHCNKTSVWLNNKHMQRRPGTPDKCWI